MSADSVEKMDELLSLEKLPPDSLTQQHRFALSDLLESTADHESLEKLADRARRALSEFGENLRAWYAVAVYQDLVGETEQAGQQFTHLARALADHGDWAGARELAMRALPLRPDERAARTIVQSWAHLPETADIEDDAAIIEAYCPDSPDLLWHKARAADEEGDHETAASLAAQALKHFIRLDQPGRVEEPLLRVLESDAPSVCRSLLLALPRMAAADMIELLDMSLELIAPKVDELQLHEDLAGVLERILTERDHLQHLRPRYVDALAETIEGDTRQARAFITECGLADESIPFEQALAQFREMFKFRPGAFVEHHSFGVGRIKSSDGDFLWIDFEGKPDHRMALEIATRSLRSLPADCLQAVLFAQPDRISQEAEDDPVKLLARALSDADGEAKARQLRELLAGEAIPQDEWSAWWQRARNAAKSDDRVDTSQAFRQVYRLPGEGPSDEVELPPLPAKGEIRGAVNLINRLLRQHPDLEERAQAEYAEELADRATSARPSEALVAIPVLVRWAPEQSEQWQEIARQGFRTEPGVAVCPTADGQMELLDIGLQSDAWRSATLTALGSRFRQVRERALDQLRQRLEDRFGDVMREIAFERDDLPATHLAIVRMYLNETIERSIFTPWEAVRIVAGIIAYPADQKTIKGARELMSPSGELCQLLQDATPTPDDIEQVRRAADELADNQIATEPLRNLMRWAGHDNIADELAGGVETVSTAKPIELHFADGVTLMTRATYEANLRKIDSLEHELAAEIPQAIARARALGDLSENAAYHAARERQGIADANLRALKSLMDRAAPIEDLRIPEDTAAAGTEVTVRDLDEDAERTFWILGQGDSEHGDNVINYKAPLGQALVGHQPGDTVEFEVNGEERRFEILSISKKLP